MQNTQVIYPSSPEAAFLGTSFVPSPDSVRPSIAIAERSTMAAPTLSNFSRAFAGRVITVTVLAIISVGLLSTVLDGSWSNGPDVERIGPILSTWIASMAMLAMWLAFQRWNTDGDALSSRLAIAIPGLAWASQGISAPVLLNEPMAHQLPGAARIGAGLVAVVLIACDVFRPQRPFGHTFTARLVASVGAAAGVATAISWGLKRHPQLQFDVRHYWSTVAMPASLGILGIAFVASRVPFQAVLRRFVGVALLLLGGAQLIGRPELEPTEAGRALLTGGLGVVAMLVLLGGLGHSLGLASEDQRRRLIIAQLDVAQGVDVLQAERLRTSMRNHDQNAALLAVEAVINLLESSDGMDPASRRRLCAAATSELRRLQGTQTRSQEIELRSVVEPVVELARVAGASVTCSIRGGLAVDTGSGLTDVIRNLVSNAVFHGGNSEVVLAARRVDYEFIELTVTDNGPGVRSARRFDLFEAGRSSGGPGNSGLGLNSARSLLREMGGDLQLDRTHTNGARFVARIPAAMIGPPDRT